MNSNREAKLREADNFVDDLVRPGRNQARLVEVDARDLIVDLTGTMSERLGSGAVQAVQSVQDTLKPATAILAVTAVTLQGAQVASARTAGSVGSSGGVRVAQVTPEHQPRTNNEDIDYGAATSTAGRKIVSMTIPAGDTMSQIAEADQVSLPKLEAINPEVPDPDLIYTGRTLRVEAPQTSRISSTGRKIVDMKIRSGETMSQIAVDDQLSLFTLESINPEVTNPNLIYTGRTLRVESLPTEQVQQIATQPALRTQQPPVAVTANVPAANLPTIQPATPPTTSAPATAAPEVPAPAPAPTAAPAPAPATQAAPTPEHATKKQRHHHDHARKGSGTHLPRFALLPTHAVTVPTHRHPKDHHAHRRTGIDAVQHEASASITGIGRSTRSSADTVSAKAIEKANSIASQVLNGLPGGQHHAPHHHAQPRATYWGDPIMSFPDKGIYTVRCTPDGPKIPGNNTAQIAFNYFVVCDYDTPAQASGIVGNLQQESGVQPERVQGGGLIYSRNPANAGAGGWGISQWTPGAKALSVASAYGITAPIYTLQAQLEMVTDQMKHVSPTGNKNIQKVIKTVHNPTQSATVFEAQFEEGKVAYSGGGQLASRQAYARQAEAQYARTALRLAAHEGKTFKVDHASHNSTSNMTPGGRPHPHTGNPSSSHHH